MKSTNKMISLAMMTIMVFAIIIIYEAGSLKVLNEMKVSKIKAVSRDDDSEKPEVLVLEKFRVLFGLKTLHSKIRVSENGSPAPSPSPITIEGFAAEAPGPAPVPAPAPATHAHSHHHRSPRPRPMEDEAVDVDEDELRNGSSFKRAARASGLKPKSVREINREIVWRSSPVCKMLDISNAKSSDSFELRAVSESIDDC